MEFDFKLADRTCFEFVDGLSIKDPVPGGGGAAAMTGAMGAALAGMVGKLTIGKKKYVAFEEDIKGILGEARFLQERLVFMIDEDADNFLPLAKAYKLPKNTEKEKAHREKVLEKHTKKACEVPAEIVETCYKAILLHERLMTRCSAMVLSDVAVGVQCLRAAMISGWINVLINTKTLKDRDYAASIENRLKPLLKEGIAICDRVYSDVEKRLL